MGNYIDINLNDVKGYESLTTSQQKLFLQTYKLHNSMVGTDYKKEWKPVMVSRVKDQEDENTVI